MTSPELWDSASLEGWRSTITGLGHVDPAHRQVERAHDRRQEQQRDRERTVDAAQQVAPRAQARLKASDSVAPRPAVRSSMCRITAASTIAETPIVRIEQAEDQWDEDDGVVDQALRHRRGDREGDQQGAESYEPRQSRA